MTPPLVRPRLFEAGEARLAALDALARRLWLGGLTNAQGELEARLAALVELRAALLAGRLPEPTQWAWPPPAVATALHRELTRLNLAAYCEAREELADSVLGSLLFHVDLIVDYQDRGASEELAIAMAVEAFGGDWEDRCTEIDELVDVFGRLPDDGQELRWEQMRGLLHSAGWQEVLRIRRLLAGLPELAEIIRRLGRAQPSDMDDETSWTPLQVMEQATAQLPHSRRVRVPEMPGETRGIYRSGRIARMLPAEAVLLGHPRLRLVWHARRAERALLTYEEDDRMQEVHLHQTLVRRPRPARQAGKRQQMGPILVCVDTSGSMQGGAEAVAKATVLEAVRTAHAQRRACHVLCFGGPDEVVDMELGVNTAGIRRLIAFLGQAFRGGTDICAPLERSIALLEQQQWRCADLLIASDGEFGATPELVARLDAAKQALGLRVQGVLVGDRETVGLLEIADDIFAVRDWRRYGGAKVDSPIHSSRLTAMYFPGALRNAESREATVSGAAASAAVRAGLHRSDAILPPTKEAS